MIHADEQMRVILKGVHEVIDREELRTKLEQSIECGEPLTVKLGLDPSAPDIHLGHAVVLRKMKQLQDLGHRVVIVIGDFTGMIGDPTGKSKTRRPLTRDEVLQNAATYERQIFGILDPQKTQIRFNSRWLGELRFADVMTLASRYTVARMLEREDFRKRFEGQQSIGIHEFFYPLMQGYDSVALFADIELGGTDQRFNILMGRKLQKDYGQDSQVALFMPILEGTDGVEKMSKSLGNTIGIHEPPGVMFEKVMSIPDGLILRYFELATDVHPDTIDAVKARLEAGENPRNIKWELAIEITGLYHGQAEARSAADCFDALFSRREIPRDIPSLAVDDTLCYEGRADLIRILVAAGYASGRGEARRLMAQGGVCVNGTPVTESCDTELKDGDIIRVGKRKYLKISMK